MPYITSDSPATYCRPTLGLVDVATADPLAVNVRTLPTASTVSIVMSKSLAGVAPPNAVPKIVTVSVAE